MGTVRRHRPNARTPSLHLARRVQSRRLTNMAVDLGEFGPPHRLNLPRSAGRAAHLTMRPQDLSLRTPSPNNPTCWPTASRPAAPEPNRTAATRRRHLRSSATRSSTESSTDRTGQEGHRHAITNGIGHFAAERLVLLTFGARGACSLGDVQNDIAYRLILASASPARQAL